MKTKNIEDIYQLTPVQKGMLFHCLYDSELSLYFFQHVFGIYGNLNVELFEKAWQLVVDRHPILRTSFYWSEIENPLQIVHSRVKISLSVYDWSGMNSGEREKQFQSLIICDRQQNFDFSQPCLMRHTLIRVADDYYKYIWSFNHIIIDGWGGSLVFQEFVETYGKLCKNQEASLAPTRPFGDYIDWLEKQDISKAENFWRSALKGIKAPTSLAYIEQTEEDNRWTEREVKYSEEIVQLSLESTQELDTFATQNRLTLATIINGLWAILVSRYSGCDNVLYGCTVTGRPADLKGIESMIGMFVNTLPIHANINKNQSLLSWLQRFQLQLVETRNYEYTPLIEVQQWSELPQNSTLFNSIVVLEDFPVSEFIKDWKGNLEFRHTEIYYRNNYPLNLVVYPNKELLIAVSYDSRKFDPDTITGILKDIQIFLQQLIVSPNVKIKDLSFLTSEQKRNAAILEKDAVFNWNYELCS